MLWVIYGGWQLYDEYRQCSRTYELLLRTDPPKGLLHAKSPIHPKFFRWDEDYWVGDKYRLGNFALNYRSSIARVLFPVIAAWGIVLSVLFVTKRVIAGFRKKENKTVPIATVKDVLYKFKKSILASRKIAEVFFLYSIKYLKALLKGLCYYSGLKFVFHKFIPRSDSDKLPTGPIWIIGIYFAAFGIASQKYENRVDIIENRANAVIVMLANKETRKRAFRNIPKIQNMECPIKPNFQNPILTIKSLFGVSRKHQETIKLLINVIEDLKYELSGAHLNYGIFDGANLGGANLEGASLAYASLKETNLSEANLKKAILVNANLQNAYLSLANLEDANFETSDLRGAHLSGPTYRVKKNSDGTELFKIEETNAKGAYFYGAKFWSADFSPASLHGVDLTGAILLKAKIKPYQLCKASSIADCKIDADLELLIKQQCPRVFNKEKKGTYFIGRTITKMPEENRLLSSE